MGHPFFSENLGHIIDILISIFVNLLYAYDTPNFLLNINDSLFLFGKKMEVGHKRTKVLFYVLHEEDGEY